MNDVKNGEKYPHPQATDPKAETANPEAGGTGQEADPVAMIAAEKAEMQDRLLRTLADMENLRRRTEKEVADARKFGITGFARDMLAVADNLRRAIESLPKDLAETLEGPLKGLVDGIELTERDLVKTLERHGVKAVNPTGQKFDPSVHQAMFEAPDAQVPKGHVVQVIQTGYVIGERVLRPALVGVSAGAPRPAEPNGEGVDKKA